MNFGSRAVQRAGLLAALLLLAAPASIAGRSADLESVRAAAEEGKTQRALRRLDKILNNDSELLEGYLLRGVLLVELGRSPAAEEAFRDLALRAPDLPEPVNNLAVLQAASGRVDDAVAALEELVGKYPGYGDAATNLETLRGQSTGEGGAPAIEGEPRPRLILSAELGSNAPAEPRPTPVPAPSRPPAPAATEPEKATPTVVVTAPQAPTAEPVAEPTNEAAAPEPEPAPEAESAAGGEPPPEAAPQPPGGDLSGPAATTLRGELAGMVEAWAAAWSQQRVREYLAFYAADFEPTDYGSRQAWESGRRQRVAAPSFIEVEIDFDSMELRETGSGEVDVTFTQRYRSDRFGDTVEKTLTLVREAGAWRIRRETGR